jgi:Domain of unknown function (DUF4169)
MQYWRGGKDYSAPAYCIAAGPQIAKFARSRSGADARIDAAVVVIQCRRPGVIPDDEAARVRPHRLYLCHRRASMGDIVNLRTARKQAKRRQAEQKAASNRLAHGRSKLERTLEQSRSEKARKSLDQHRIETGDGS